MSKQLVFIDESGDAGLTGSHSSRFIIAAVVMMHDNEDALIRTKMTEYRKTLGWHELDEFKFSRTRKTIIKELLILLAPYKFKVYGIIMDKTKKFNNPQTSNRYSLYNYVLAELLKILPEGDKKIYIDGEAGKKYHKHTLVFLRRQLSCNNSIISLKYLKSNACNILQLADVVAGSIGRSLSDNNDKEDYIRLLEGKIAQIKEL